MGSQTIDGRPLITICWLVRLCFCQLSLLISLSQQSVHDSLWLTVTGYRLGADMSLPLFSLSFFELVLQGSNGFNGFPGANGEKGARVSHKANDSLSC